MPEEVCEMARILDVPYRSQWDADANKSTTDCGPACLAMVLSYYGTQVSINELYTATGVAPGLYVGFGQLQRVARAHNLTFTYGQNFKLNHLKRWIDQGKPSIALVKYSYWSHIEPGISTQDTFTGPHFVVVVGYDDQNVYINDPNYWPPRRQEGHKKAWSEVLFNLAWSNVRTPSVFNPNNAVIVPTVGKLEVTPPQEAQETLKVIEYVVQPGDTWSGIAGKFYGDQTRYPEILAFNNQSPGASLFVGQKLRIPVPQEKAPEEAPTERVIVLGEGATQTVDSELIDRLREQWIDAGKVDATADEAAVLRAFVDEMTRSEPEAVQAYVVRPGDTWAGIAGKFYGDQTRYREIITFNNLSTSAPLFAGQKLRIPPK
jgi:nucleoid-associated protein YgaU/uncharacterized protein YvpB